MDRNTLLSLAPLTRIDARERAAQPSRAALAGAAPVSGEAIHLTNSHWSFHTRELCQAAGLEKIHVLNDFEVLAPCP